MGADCVLLICALLDTKTLRAISRRSATNFGLSALVETHDADDPLRRRGGREDHRRQQPQSERFFRRLFNAARLRDRIPAGGGLRGRVRRAEHAGRRRARSIGADAVLIGETLMRAPDKARRLAELRVTYDQGETLRLTRESLAPTMGSDQLLVVTISGRGDK